MKALIIDEPWIGLILRGEKTWEMRRTACHQKGQIALIRKGSGQVVGVADCAGSLPALADADAYRAAEPRHRIPVDRQAQAFADRWRTPWVLTNARPLDRPVAYAHRSGAVIWVNLDPEVVAAVAAQLVGRSPPEASQHPVMLTLGEPMAASQAGVQPDANQASSPPDGTVRDVTITGGNLRNGHIYLPLEFFPADAIGGSNKSQTAPRTITVTFHPGATVQTDIDRTKRILRARAQVGDFLVRSGVTEGEAVRIICTSPYAYDVSKVTDV